MDELAQKLNEAERQLTTLQHENRSLSQEKHNLMTRLEAMRDKSEDFDSLSVRVSVTTISNVAECASFFLYFCVLLRNQSVVKRLERERDLLKADIQRLEDERDTSRHKMNVSNHTCAYACIYLVAS